jgi:hypothetical protein
VNVLALHELLFLLEMCIEIFINVLGKILFIGYACNDGNASQYKIGM